MIENEHRVVKKLSQHSCKHVVAVLDLGTFPDASHYFIDMELCDIHLGQYIYESPSSQFEINRIWSIMGQISDGVAFIHSHKEVHRDLKPCNSNTPLPQHLLTLKFCTRLRRIVGRSRTLASRKHSQQMPCRPSYPWEHQVIVHRNFSLTGQPSATGQISGLWDAFCMNWQ